MSTLSKITNSYAAPSVTIMSLIALSLDELSSASAVRNTEAVELASEVRIKGRKGR